ncbi:hypothetical protein scyTo_0000854, partial [Scyliorhinus torazame]|nr:hypothetical protein [Scyliorhinus torazame]
LEHLRATKMAAAKLDPRILDLDLDRMLDAMAER